MNARRVGTCVVAACLLVAAGPSARGSDIGRQPSIGAITSVAGGQRPGNAPAYACGITPVQFSGGVPGSFLGGLPPAHFAGACGPAGFAGMSGCLGSHVIGMCGFGGCISGPVPFCMGSMSGCLGFMPAPAQTYSKWTPSPNRAYYHRTLHVQTPPPSDMSFEFVLVHYPDRPKFLYYFDPADKKYTGRYRLGVKPEECFQLLAPASRKSSLNDIPESAYRNVGGMPTLGLMIQTKGTADATLKSLKLLRPPEWIPDDQLGLPAEEPTFKKAPPKK